MPIFIWRLQRAMPTILRFPFTKITRGNEARRFRLLIEDAKRGLLSITDPQSHAARERQINTWEGLLTRYRRLGKKRMRLERELAACLDECE